MEPDRCDRVAQREPLFPSARAFIVHFTRDAELVEQVRGRVEHVTTGRSKQFSTIDDLFAFVREVMQDGRADGATTVNS